MGRVKTKNIKRVATELIDTYPDQFSDNFEENKQKIEELTTVQSKPMRNKIAGYIMAVKKRLVD